MAAAKLTTKLPHNLRQAGEGYIQLKDLANLGRLYIITEVESGQNAMVNSYPHT